MLTAQASGFGTQRLSKRAVKTIGTNRTTTLTATSSPLARSSSAICFQPKRILEEPLRLVAQLVQLIFQITLIPSVEQELEINSMPKTRRLAEYYPTAPAADYFFSFQLG
jgi:hypothetical protein